MRPFYRPTDGVLTDVIPFYWNGEYHLFYLKDYRETEKHGEGTPWFHLVTRDFVFFEECGEVIPRGAATSNDLFVFTGCVLERDGVFHIFYTGHNPHLKDKGQPVETILHATSPDLRTWTKDLSFAFGAPHGLEKDDWRDPFVFWSEAEQEYSMLITARQSRGPSRHRGLIARAASSDLKSWQMREPFWSPQLYHTHECPDLFRIGEWWYLLYSEFTERHLTHYRMSRSLQGPWLAPVDDAFDGRAFYAAKTAGDEKQRFLFGWLPTRSGETDSGEWQWGGNLVVHQIAQRPDGTLAVHASDEVLKSFSQHVSMQPESRLGEWKTGDGTADVSCVDSLAVLSLGEMPDSCLIETTVMPAPGTANCGVLLRAGDYLESSYQVRLELNRQRLVFDRWPRSGDQPFMVERLFAPQPGTPIVLRIIVDGSCAVAYVNDEVALSCRLYDHKIGACGLFASEGQVQFKNISVKTRPERRHFPTVTSKAIFKIKRYQRRKNFMARHMMRSTLVAGVALCASAFTISSHADVKLHGLFTDDMIYAR